MHIDFKTNSVTPEELVMLYKNLVYPRVVEEKMLLLLRQGKISKWFSGIGQEAISVGATCALHSQDYIFPLHRNLGVFTARKMDFKKLFAQWQGKKSGFTQGRDRSFHFGSPEHHIVGMISHLGAMLGVANGVALGELLDQSHNIALAFSGDGGTSEGDFHEALNVAAVWNLPVIFLIENNGYGLSTPSQEQFKCKQFIDKGIGYGMEAIQIDGNNILEVYSTVQKIAQKMRDNPAPVILECLTFRMRGHEEASGTKYVPKELFDLWEKKDPVTNYQQFLLNRGILSEADITQIKADIKSNIETAIKEVEKEPEVQADNARELQDVCAPTLNQVTAPKNPSQKENMRLVDAVSKGLFQSMEKHANLVIMGQDIAEYGGVFKVTEGFVDVFGKARVRNTPITESSIIGAGYGLSIKGYKAVVEMQFADFVSCGFNQIVNNLAKSHYRWGQNADVVIRMPTGAGVGAGPFHSQSTEAWFFHVPGLKLVYPSTPSDAKGLLCAAIEDPNPVLFFEHKALYRSIQEEVPTDYYTLEIGKAHVVKEGSDLTIITYGWGVHWAHHATEELSIDATIVDLRTLLPWDQDTVKEYVQKTGKVLVLHEDTLTGGIGGEIAAWISEFCFESLDAPVYRIGGLDTPIPLAKELETAFLASSRLKDALIKLMDY